MHSLGDTLKILKNGGLIIKYFFLSCYGKLLLSSLISVVVSCVHGLITGNCCDKLFYQSGIWHEDNSVIVVEN